MLDREEERERAMGGAEDRLLLRTNSAQPVEEDGHHPACRERMRAIL